MVSRWERGVSVPQPHYRQKLAEIFEKSLLELDLFKETQQEALQPVVLLPAQERPTARQFYKIPHPTTPLLGREQEIADISALLTRQEVQLVTLLGSGGVGKTRVGLEIALQTRHYFSDGLCFIPLSTVNDFTLVVSMLAKALEIYEYGTSPLLDQIKNFLCNKSFLLVFDNFEHIVTAALLIEDLIDTCPRLKVVVTSREALHLQAEFRFAISPLPLPDLMQLPEYEDLVHLAAVSLFTQRAKAHKPMFQVNPQNIRAIVELCTHLDGLPLAIELAASHVELLPPQVLLTRLPQYLYTLRNNIQNAPLRQQTLHTTIKWSYDLLSSQERWLFRHFSIFTGSVSLATLEAFFITSEKPDCALVESITSLLDKSLLISTHVENADTRITMLETLRHYGLDCLQAEGELEECRYSHATFYLHYVEKIATYLTGKQQAIGLQQLEQEQDNLRAALSWLIERRESMRALRFCEAFGKFCGLHGYWSEERRWLNLTLELPSVSEGRAIRARVLRRAGHLAYRFRDLSAARKLLEESVTLARELGDMQALAGALSGLGWVMYRQNEKAAAYCLHHESVSVARKSGDAWSLANTLESFGRFMHYAGRMDEASTFLAESISISRKLLDKECLARTLTTLVAIQIAQGNSKQATMLAEESFALAQELGTKPLIALVLSCLGDVALHQKAYEQAQKHFEASISLAYDLGDEPAIASRQQKLADIALLQRV